jgi:hypothetical protein
MATPPEKDRHEFWRKAARRAAAVIAQVASREAVAILIEEVLRGRP